MTANTTKNDHARNRRPLWIGAVIGALLLGVGGVWLARQPLAEWLARTYCAGQDLECSLKITRLGLDGVAVEDLDVRAPGGEQPAILARILNVSLDWDFPVKVRATSVQGDGIDLQVDLTGSRGVLGDLDAAVQHLTSNRKPSTAPPPTLEFRNVRVHGDTLWGPIEASGRFISDGAGALDLEMIAPAVHLMRGEDELDFEGAAVAAKIVGQELSGAVRFDLGRMRARGTNVDGAKFEMDLQQSGGGMVGRGSGNIASASMAAGHVEGAVARLDLSADAIDLSDLSLAGLASRVRELTISGEAATGGVEGANVRDFKVSVDIDPVSGGGAAGDVKIAAAELSHAFGRASAVAIDGKVEVGGEVDGASGRSVRASGVARLTGANLSESTGDDLAKTIGGLFGGVLPTFGKAAESTVRKAGEKFDMVLPWSFRLDDGETDASALTGSELKAASGFALRLEGRGEAPPLSWESGETSGWKAAGLLRASGGGGPAMLIDVADASGGKGGVGLAGSATLENWKAGDESVTASVTEASYQSGDAGGRFAGKVNAAVTGIVGGVRWTRLRTDTGIEAEWTPEAFKASSAKALRADWDAAQVGGTRIGAGSLVYTPDGQLATGGGGVMSGAGTLAGIEAALSGSNFNGQLRLGALHVDWTRSDAMEARYRLAPTHILVQTGDGGIPIDIGSVTGAARLGEGWRVNGKVANAGALAETVSASDIAATFDLSGGGTRKVRGSLDDVQVLLSDPAPAGSRLFEEVKFDGRGDLANGVARFTGVFAMVKSGVQVANVEGRHDLDAGKGDMAFAETPLIFRPKSFEPKDISPVLRGAAKVSGRVDLSGLANWSADGLAASARMNVRGLGFTVASAGVFEGVSGVVEVSDVLHMRSDPGQTLLIEKVTLGLPIADGAVRFQLDGFDRVQLEDARWPFVGGLIRLKPATFHFGPVENRIIANAVGWDLAKVVELFKVPDTRIQGIVNGEFPVVFSTGSARIDNAVLEASTEGGVIQYKGETTDAAADANENAKMLFDALKDFQYRVLKIGLDGDLAGRMVLTLNIEGHNPDVMAGSPFKLNISIDSELAELVNTLKKGTNQIDAVINQARGTSN